MQALTLDELDRESQAFDRAVLASGDLDLFCSSSDWVVPAARALQPGRAARMKRGEHGWVALVRAERTEGTVDEPLEAMWGLACPVVGAEPRPLAREWAASLREEKKRATILLCGLFPRSPRLAACAEALAPTHALGLGPETGRFVASLDGGLDGFLSRRPRSLRKGLERADRRARDRGVTFERVDAASADPIALYERVLAVDGKSWKGEEGVGLAASSMADFYRVMVPRLARRRALRLMFARADGRDVGYILGGLFGDTYRGLQFAFARGFEECALGNLCQLREIASLTESSTEIRLYDLGSDAEYKRRWGELTHTSIALVAWPK